MTDQYLTAWHEAEAMGRVHGPAEAVNVLRQHFVPRVEVVEAVDQFDEDYFADAIAATMGPDWSPRDAAKLILQEQSND